MYQLSRIGEILDTFKQRLECDKTSLKRRLQYIWARGASTITNEEFLRNRQELDYLRTIVESALHDIENAHKHFVRRILEHKTLIETLSRACHKGDWEDEVEDEDEEFTQVLRNLKEHVNKLYDQHILSNAGASLTYERMMCQLARFMREAKQVERMYMPLKRAKFCVDHEFDLVVKYNLDGSPKSPTDHSMQTRAREKILNRREAYSDLLNSTLQGQRQALSQRKSILKAALVARILGGQKFELQHFIAQWD